MSVIFTIYQNYILALTLRHTNMCVLKLCDVYGQREKCMKKAQFNTRNKLYILNELSATSTVHSFFHKFLLQRACTQNFEKDNVHCAMSQQTFSLSFSQKSVKS